MSNSNLMKPDYDVIVIGAGPAGFSAAIYLSRFLLKTLLLETPAYEQTLDNPRNSVRSSTPGRYYNLPGFPEGIERAVFKGQGIAQAQINGCEYRQGKVQAIYPENDYELFRVDLDGETITTKQIVLAMGIQDQWPDCPDIRQFSGRSAFTSVQSNGMEARNFPAAVLGNNDTAFEEAIRLCAYSPKVYLLTNGEVLKVSERLRWLNMSFPIEVIEEPIQTLSGTDGQIETVTFERGKTIDIHTLFSPMKHKHASDLLTHRLGLKKDKDQFIIVDASYATSMPNVYAIGDMIQSPHKQVVTSMYHGMEVACAIGEKCFRKTLQNAALELEY